MNPYRLVRLYKVLNRLGLKSCQGTAWSFAGCYNKIHTMEIRQGGGVYVDGQAIG